MPSKDTKMLEFSQYRKFDKLQFIIYEDFKSLMPNIDRCIKK